MAGGLMLARFTEYQRYDINRDCEVTQFCVSISTGTYHMEAPVKEGMTLREMRNKFRERVQEMISDGLPPQEVSLG